MARRSLIAVFLTVMAFVVAVPADFGVAQLLMPPEDVGPPRQRRLAPLRPPPQQKQGGFFEMLFGPRLFQPFRQQRFPNQQGFGPPLVPSEPPVPTVVIAPKDPAAKKILVIGDFVATGLAWGLDQTYAEDPKLAVVDRSNSNSGLVRADFYDWNAELLKILNEEKPDIVIIALGANDRQQMRLDKERVAPRTELWEKTYVQRVVSMTDSLKVFGRPFFWISAPPVRLSAGMRDMAYLNEFYKPPVSTAGGHFIDIWGGFTNEDGRYISSGPDVDGQLRALRTGDGINFTRAGRLKLAFYVDREIRKQTGIGGAVDLLASTNQTSQIEIGPDGQKHLVGPVISLTDPLPGISVLSGGPEQAPKKPGDTPQELMVVKGEALPIVAGRADDFAWPPHPRMIEPAPEQPAKAANN